MSLPPHDLPLPEPESVNRERRFRVRVDVLGQVEAHSVWRIQPLALQELSLTGLSLDATAPFEVGSIHKFRLSLESERRSVVVQARARHCTLISAKPNGLAIYRVGFEFIAATDSILRELIALVEAAKSMWNEAV
ncbi:MAG: PilZ domain-containing protein [Acidobacteriota bacterium]